jgi:hypothetical protein
MYLPDMLVSCDKSTFLHIQDVWCKLLVECLRVLLAGTSSTLQSSALTWQKKLELMGKMDNGLNPVGEGASGSSGSATELSSLLPPPAMPLLATFLATRREVPSGSFCGPPAIANDPTDSVDIWANVRTRQRRLKRTRRTHR